MPAGLSAKQRYRIEYRALKRLAADFHSCGLGARYANRCVYTKWGVYRVRWGCYNTIGMIFWDDHTLRRVA